MIALGKTERPEIVILDKGKHEHGKRGQRGANQPLIVSAKNGIHGGRYEGFRGARRLQKVKHVQADMRFVTDTYQGGFDSATEPAGRVRCADCAQPRPKPFYAHASCICACSVLAGMRGVLMRLERASRASLPLPVSPQGTKI